MIISQMSGVPIYQQIADNFTIGFHVSPILSCSLTLAR